MITKDSRLVRNLMEPYLPIEGFTPEGWIKDKDNICLTDDEGNIALFENIKPKVFYGHYFFKARGRDAIDAAKLFLEEIFQQSVEVIIGLTPSDNKAAKWMSRHIGFTSHGEIETDQGPHELFILTKKEYENG